MELLPQRSGGGCFKTPHPHPWRPILGYENVEVMPMPSQPITSSLTDPCYVPCSGMSTEPLKFPNMVTGFDRNQSHAARAALYTRYTLAEWNQSNKSHFCEADTNRNHSEQIRSKGYSLIKQMNEHTAEVQLASGQRLGEKLTDTTFWRNELAAELGRMENESNLLQDKRRELEKAIQDTEGPAFVGQECFYHREHRVGIELVHDLVEQTLLKELETTRTCRDMLTALHKQVTKQLMNNRAAQHELEMDLRAKENALGIDNVCHQLSNHSRGLHYYAGIEKYDPTISNTETWAQHSNKNLQRAQDERAKSAQMRSDADNMMQTCAADIWAVWIATNNALTNKVAELLEAKNRLQMHLHKIQQELFDMEMNMENMRRSIADKSKWLMVVHTRLEARTRRREMDLCRDEAMLSLISEAGELSATVDKLNQQLTEAECQHQQLLRTKNRLEAELENKVNAIFIDRDKCLGMRRCFPVMGTIGY